MVRAIVGANWGDEGKGKITDLYASQSDFVVRFQGGANAGHTIINDKGKFALHLLPSGVFYPNIVNIIGNGVAFNAELFFKELDSLRARGVEPQVKISERAQLVMPYHVLFDQYEEERLGKNGFGSTKMGIAPFYSDKYAKTGFQLWELYEEAHLRKRLAAVLEVKNLLLRELYHKPEFTVDGLMETLDGWAQRLRPFIANTFELLYKANEEGKTILLEGQLGSLKDPDFGIYPFTTSSHTLAGFGAVGAGVAPRSIQHVTTVVKAYSSAVGAGPFVSEIFGDEAKTMRDHGGDAGEYGATTGRPRRMGWFDCVATRYGCRLQGTTEVALTVLDALGYLREIPVCVAYEADGKTLHEFPNNAVLERAKPVLETLPGWNCDIRGIKKYEDLPENCRRYVEFIEKHIGFPVTIVTNGPRREEFIRRG